MLQIKNKIKNMMDIFIHDKKYSTFSYDLKEENDTIILTITFFTYKNIQELTNIIIAYIILNSELKVTKIKYQKELTNSVLKYKILSIIIQHCYIYINKF